VAIAEALDAGSGLGRSVRPESVAHPERALAVRRTLGSNDVPEEKTDRRSMTWGGRKAVGPSAVGAGRQPDGPDERCPLVEIDAHAE
jgi:hypothetical protein